MRQAIVTQEIYSMTPKVYPNLTISVFLPDSLSVFISLILFEARMAVENKPGAMLAIKTTIFTPKA